MNVLPKIALGTWSWGVGAVGGNEVFGNKLGEEELKPVFDKAMEKGLNLWDTAVVYGMGASETILGKLAASYPRGNVVYSTKFTPQIADGTEKSMEEMLSGSCRRLGTNIIDIYWIHNPADVEKWTPFLIPLAKAGKIRNIGISNHNLEQIKRVMEILEQEGLSLAAVQNHYSLLYRSSETAGILDFCREHQIDFYAYMVLEQGALSGKYDAGHLMPTDSQRGKTYNPILPEIENLLHVMKKIADVHEATPAQIAVAWAIAKGTRPIVGVTAPEQVEEMSGAAELCLDEKEIAELEALANASHVDTRGSWENPMV